MTVSPSQAGRPTSPRALGGRASGSLPRARPPSRPLLPSARGPGCPRAAGPEPRALRAGPSRTPTGRRRGGGQGEDGAIAVYYYLAARTRETLYYYYSNNYNYYRCRQTQIDFYFG